MEKGSKKVMEYIANYRKTEFSNVLYYGVHEQTTGKCYVARYKSIESISAWIAIDIDHDGFSALRIEPDKKLRSKVKSEGFCFEYEDMEKYKGNKGERFEQWLSKKLGVPYEGKDSRPYNEACDIIDGLERISAKFERATIARIETIEKAMNDI